LLKEESCNGLMKSFVQQNTLGYLI